MNSRVHRRMLLLYYLTRAAAFHSGGGHKITGLPPEYLPLSLSVSVDRHPALDQSAVVWQTNKRVIVVRRSSRHLTLDN
jgi:hypothetical protein